jgi:hypothetical protein
MTFAINGLELLNQPVGSRMVFGLALILSFRINRKWGFLKFSIQNDGIFTEKAGFLSKQEDFLYLFRQIRF